MAVINKMRARFLCILFILTDSKHTHEMRYPMKDGCIVDLSLSLIDGGGFGKPARIRYSDHSHRGKTLTDELGIDPGDIGHGANATEEFTFRNRLYHPSQRHRSDKNRCRRLLRPGFMRQHERRHDAGGHVVVGRSGRQARAGIDAAC
jgi:hypothetical protein